MDILASLPIANIAIILGGIQAAKVVDFTDPNVLNTLRYCWILSTVLVSTICFMVWSSIKQRNDKRPLADMPDPTATSTSTGSKAKNVHDYDMMELKKMIRGQLIGTAIVSVIHFYLKQNPPLISQCIIPLKGVLQSKLVQIHIFNKADVGELKRPFNEGPGLLSYLKDSKDS
ncbi:hypothetical protein P175DRAFT_0492710 [Aspergillus ochraceoroseus IBT 24754]|uniref:Uncharacterized protein n=1 Tax=Aspergillus ochraceoroseus IBT 24754 TaxID=1392256 RepID=A0A2T5M0Q7_9EURO|nr:uncharacterized protein P175DRAFT_0492710 [Aspergillus ochraceoroseus IBT 24754]PTU22109.1 hypothetical protein P175DRAFT_0492710 [Aspergillus ochraceoroseus IBT 24754]